MLTWLIVIGSAAPLDLDPWIEVQVAEAAQGALLESERVFVRTPRGCLPARIHPGPDPRLEIERCARTLDDGRAVRCITEAPLQVAWAGETQACTWTAPDGSQFGSVAQSAHTSTDALHLVDLTDEVAVWREVVALRAEPASWQRRQRPCTAHSLRALGPRAPADGVRTCDEASGLVVAPAPVGVALGVGVALAFDPRPVDCAVPCPEDPDLERVRAENARLAGRRFAHREGRTISLHRTAEDCAAWTGGPAFDPGPAACPDAPEPPAP